jgi:DMSO/TMAO reductase YedYZ molybdopterin-dependent catalytic subunit
MTSVKWLERITLIDTPFEGYQQAHAYRLAPQRGHEASRSTRMRRGR